MSTAVARTRGNKTLIQSLYIKLRCEELGRQRVKDIASAQQQEQKQAEDGKRHETIAKSKQRWPETQDEMACPHCDYHGTMVVRSRRTPLVLWIICLTSPVLANAIADAIENPNALYLIMPVPLLLYLLLVRGYKAVCPACGVLAKDHVPLPDRHH